MQCVVAIKLDQHNCCNLTLPKLISLDSKLTNLISTPRMILSKVHYLAHMDGRVLSLDRRLIPLYSFVASWLDWLKLLTYMSCMIIKC
jgi:hypothetical protein